ncbi:hypothetical protein [Pelagibius sp. Alg239-R121]|uniref:hypothetical protein n=1 Tax=Pelagibius sp. Alg239-R121 TaxID=2993448 RepID=UPI0024A725A0|nr:hypothetical protein [Pelagibius sp. Alg239-R121]
MTGMLLAVACVLSGTSGWAVEERRLEAAEITALLTGQTALGENRGRDTRQYFDASGRTDYVERGGQVDPGKWRVDDAKNQYCSLWARGGWACYDITTDGTRYYWVGEGYHSPFSMVEGRKLKF